jgi:hypothetical protein
MDLDRIKRNVGKMVEQNAPESDIDQYIASEGVTLDQVRGHRTAMIDPRAAQPQQAAQPNLSAGETAADVAKSLGIGVAQGGIGLATLPGNVEQLGRMGINAASRGLGGNDIVSNDAVLPTYNDAKTAIEGYTGEFYKPQTTMGEYARTIGEFAPMAATGGGGLAARAANVIAPALVSETAGQVTKGTAMEPWARMAGAFAGGIVPRSVSPVPVDPTRTAMVRQLEGEGVTALTAGQKTGSTPLRWMESVTQDIPGGGGRAKMLADKQAEQFTRAALKRAGIAADRATPDVIDAGFTQLGQKFDNLARQTTVVADRPFINQLDRIAKDYNDLLAPSLRAPIVDNLVNELKQMRLQHPTPGGSGGFVGREYQALRSRIDALRRNAGPNTSGPSDQYLSRALGDIRDALDDAMERQLGSRPGGAALADGWRNARREYKNLLVVEKAVQGAGENTALGLISPSQLRTAAKQQNKRAYVRGKDDLGPLARAGEAIMKPLPQSGTAPRAYAQGLMHTFGTASGAAAGGAPGAALGAIASMATPALGSRALMSRPVQSWLSNQAAAGYMAGRPPLSANALVAPQISQEYGLVGSSPTGRPLFQRGD